jgi:hypothetical protein
VARRTAPRYLREGLCVSFSGSRVLWYNFLVVTIREGTQRNAVQAYPAITPSGGT